MAGTAFLFVCFCLTDWLTFVLIVLKFIENSSTWFVFHFWNKASLTHWQAKPEKKITDIVPKNPLVFTVHLSLNRRKLERGSVPQNTLLFHSSEFTPHYSRWLTTIYNAALGKADAFGLCRHTHVCMSTHKHFHVIKNYKTHTNLRNGKSATEIHWIKA